MSSTLCVATEVGVEYKVLNPVVENIVDRRIVGEIDPAAYLRRRS